MNLTRVVLAFLPVAVLFLVTSRLASRRRLSRAAWTVILSEAGALTLLAALWFGTLGAGGWPLVFLLLGLLVSGAERGLRFAFLPSDGRQELLGFGVGVARYVVAGAILAWRLG
jgi:hypothetical protein